MRDFAFSNSAGVVTNSVWNALENVRQRQGEDIDLINKKKKGGGGEGGANK